MTELKHVGVLGMKWGRRKASSGNRLSNHFDRSVQQKYGVKNASSKIKKAFTPVLPKTAARPGTIFNYKDSTQHAKDLFVSVKAKKVGDIVNDAAKMLGKGAMEAAVGFAIGYGAAKLSEIALR